MDALVIICISTCLEGPVPSVFYSSVAFKFSCNRVELRVKCYFVYSVLCPS